MCGHMRPLPHERWNFLQSSKEQASSANGGGSDPLNTESAGRTRENRWLRAGGGDVVGSRGVGDGDGDTGRGLWLTVADLRDGADRGNGGWRSGRSLGLAVADLGDGDGGGRGLRLAVRDDRHDRCRAGCVDAGHHGRHWGFGAHGHGAHGHGRAGCGSGRNEGHADGAAGLLSEGDSFCSTLGFVSRKDHVALSLTLLVSGAAAFRNGLLKRLKVGGCGTDAFQICESAAGAGDARDSCCLLRLVC